jgi:sugar-specific transcriptional regulator TrmB
MVLSLKDEDLCILTQLGLTPRQAEVYLTLCKLEYATARTCAKRLQIARAEIYRAIPILEKLGLIKRIITTPTTFKATQLTEGLSILLQRNIEKHNKIQAKADEFIKKSKTT